MAEDFEKLSGAEEYVAVEIELAEALDPNQEKSLHEGLEKLDAQALDSCAISAKKISLCYDPTRTSEEDLFLLIKQAGGKLEHVESAGSPLL